MSKLCAHRFRKIAIAARCCLPPVFVRPRTRVLLLNPALVCKRLHRITVLIRHSGCAESVHAEDAPFAALICSLDSFPC